MTRCWQTWARFLSTPSARRATSKQTNVAGELSGISIHALREEGDHLLSFQICKNGLFLSTPSARRATHSPKKT